MKATDTGIRFWLNGFRVRVYAENGLWGGSFRYPKGDGQEWGMVSLDFHVEWPAVVGYFAHEFMEYWLANKDLRFQSDNVKSKASDRSFFIMNHCQFSLMVEDYVAAWTAIRKKLKKYWRREQRRMKK